MNTPRSHTAAVWLQLKPVLAKGEPGRESDTGKVKYGNGFSTWVDLPYESESDVAGAPRTIHPTPGTPVHAVVATATLTGTTIGAADVVFIGDNEYNFFAAITGPGDIPGAVLLGASDSDSLDNLIATINGDAGEGTLYGTGTVAHPTVTASAGAGDTMVVTARTPGVAGNSIAVSDALTSGSWNAATLTGGVDATPASAGKELYDEDFRYLATTDITISSTSGWVKSAIASL